MMQRYLALCMLFCLFWPGFLRAQERWLRGKVVTIDEHEQKKSEVNITVTMLETGDADKTNSLGLFRILLKSIFKPGEKVTLVIDKPKWRIRYPLEGEARIPAELVKELMEVQLLPVGSKLFWTHDRIEKFINDIAEKSKQQVTPEGQPKTIDFSRYIKDLAEKIWLQCTAGEGRNRYMDRRDRGEPKRPVQIRIGRVCEKEFWGGEQTLQRIC